MRFTLGLKKSGVGGAGEGSAEKKQLEKAHGQSDLDRSYQLALRGPGRQIVWIWTAVIEWFDGSQSFDFVIGDRQKQTFHKLMALPLAETYHTDEYPVYREFSRRDRVIGKGGKVNRNEAIHSRLRESLYPSSAYQGSYASGCLRHPSLSSLS